MKTGATFSKCRKYRYALWRIWEHKKPLIMFIGLNPSVADEARNDPTITRCINYAKKWGYGGIYVGNIFAYCSTKPIQLYKIKDPVGFNNNKWLINMSEKVQKVIGIWGNHGKFKDRGKEVVGLFDRLYCLGTTKAGQPRHPLYLRKDIKPIEFNQATFVTGN